MSDIEKQHNSIFEQIRRIDENGNEFWSARDMAKVLEYSEYRHFIPVLEKEKEEIKQMDEYNYLSTEDEKRLFLRNELAKHNAQLASAAKDAGVLDSKDYAIFQNYGYKGLYGGLDAKAIHTHKGLKKSQKILDHMGSTELAANLFRATQTEDKLRREQIQGKQKANQTHYQVGAKVRQTIK